MKRKYKENFTPPTEPYTVETKTDTGGKMKHVNYRFWAGPGGRQVARNYQKYKRHILCLYCAVGVLMAAVIMLSCYICDLLNGGP